MVYSPMASERFLFINKDLESSSLKRHSVDEQNSIASHVQRGVRHHRPASKKRRKTVALCSAARLSTDRTEIPEAELLTNTCASASGPSSGTAGVLKQFVLRLDNGQQRLATVSLSPPSIRAENESSAAQRTAAELIVSPAQNQGTRDPGMQPHDISQVAINPIDPFAATSVTIDSEVLQLLQYYQRCFHPNVWYAECLTPGYTTYKFKASAVKVLHNALQSNVYLYALLACMSFRMRFVDLLPDNNAEVFLQKALVATRHHIAQVAQHDANSNEQILMIIFHLHCAEAYRLNSLAARVHLQGAVTVAGRLGGLRNVGDSHLRELLHIVDVHFSAWTYEPCKFACDFDPGPYMTAIPPQFQVSNICDHYAQACTLRACQGHGLIPDTVFDLVSEIAECTWVLQHAHEYSIECSRHATRWVNLRYLAINHRLQALVLHDPRTDALRATLTLWIYTTMTFLGPKKFCRALAPRLRLILNLAAQKNLTWRDHEDVHRWILSVGAISCAMDSAEEMWFVRKLAATYRRADFGCNIGTEITLSIIFDHFERLQVQFFYHESVQKPRLQRMAVMLFDLINLLP